MRASTGDRDSAGPGGLLRRVRAFVVAAAIACAAIGAQAAAAQAEEVNFSFDEARINLGEQKGLPLIDPSIPDPSATLSGDVDPDTGAFSAPTEGLVFPDKVLENFTVTDPLPLTIDALIEFTSLNPIEGTFDAQTGELALPSVNMGALVTVYLDGTTPDDAIGICEVSPIPLPLETTGEIVDDVTDPANPVTFAADPLDPEGAVVATWESLPAAVAQGGTLPDVVCPALDGLLGGPGGLWLSGTKVLPPPPDADGDGVPDASDQCPSQAGPASNGGCPVPQPPPDQTPPNQTPPSPGPPNQPPAPAPTPDADGDGVPNATDQCPGQAGPVANAGCPQRAKPDKGRLKVKVKPRKEKARIGRQVRFKVKVKNRGERTARRTKVCVKAPKRAVKVKGGRCERLGRIRGGKQEKAKFKVKLARRAKVGRSYTLKFKAKAKGAKNDKAKAKVRVG